MRTPRTGSLETITIFLDRSLGSLTIARLLRQSGIQVEMHDDHFPIDTSDNVWLPDVGQKGWVVLTKDDRIRYRKNELRALVNACVATFVFTGKGLTGEEAGDIIVKSLPAIQRFVRRYEPPFVAKVTRRGNVEKMNICEIGPLRKRRK